jgi:type III pantothenate kinase
MLLTIDVGNTNTVFGVYDGNILRGLWRSSTNNERTADEFYVWLMQLMDLEGVLPTDITNSIISTVVPQALFPLRVLCIRFFETTPVIVGEVGVDIGIDINLPDPKAVGADRIVNAVAAYETYGGDLIVIDFGTATTLDIVGSNGSYEGGIIVPGVNLSLEALHTAAAKLPRIAVERPQKVIGTDTISAMQSGVFWGYISLIEGLVKRVKDEYDKPMKVISTGGLASLFRHSTVVIEHLDDDLTMRGLLSIHVRNNKKEKTS